MKAGSLSSAHAAYRLTPHFGAYTLQHFVSARQVSRALSSVIFDPYGLMMLRRPHVTLSPLNTKPTVSGDRESHQPRHRAHATA